MRGRFDRLLELTSIDMIQEGSSGRSIAFARNQSVLLENPLKESPVDVHV
jgi:hypothetical protein